MKERLIELIDKKQTGGWRYVVDDYTTDVFNEEIADYLLDNGVIVLPSAVGDTVYYIDRYTNSVQADIVKYFTITKNGVKPILEHHNIKFWDMYEWGKTVFLTKEEAEKALERSEGK